MPCNSPQISDKEIRNRARIRKLIGWYRDALCRMCKVMGEVHSEDSIPSDILVWYMEHKMVDEAEEDASDRSGS
jgi:hypothetical protein